MAFRARRGFETFEKRVPGTRLEKERDGHLRRRPCCCFYPQYETLASMELIGSYYHLKKITNNLLSKVSSSPCLARSHFVRAAVFV